MCIFYDRDVICVLPPPPPPPGHTIIQQPSPKNSCAPTCKIALYFTCKHANKEKKITLKISDWPIEACLSAVGSFLINCSLNI